MKWLFGHSAVHRTHKHGHITLQMVESFNYESVVLCLTCALYTDCCVHKRASALVYLSYIGAFCTDPTNNPFYINAPVNHNYETINVILNPVLLGAQAYSKAYFGHGTGSILMAYIGCTGLETHLANCTSSTPGCHHSEDAGVRCLVQRKVLICV